jgi:mono/diheme cytochrome c family protein
MTFAPLSDGTAAAARRPLPTARALLSALLLLAVPGAARAEDAVADWAAVSALFHQRCVMCHSQEAAARGLRLDSYAGALAGSENGPVLVPGNAAASELFRRLLGESRPRMPFLSTPLAPADIDLIERWIATGLPDTAPLAPATSVPQVRP